MNMNPRARIAGLGENDLAISEFTWVVIILCSTITVLLVSVYYLSRDITIIFMHLYYFPIILLAYHYRYRGIILSLLLSTAYIGLVYYFEAGEADILTGAWLRFFVFIGIAVIVAFLAERLHKEQINLEESNQKYQNLFENMLEGFAYCQMIYDEDGTPVDWIYLKVNPAFENLTGLNNIVGKRVLEAIPNIKELTPELFDIYERVASKGKPEIFEIDFKPLNIWLKVSVFSPDRGYFIAIFEDITARKKAEAALLGSEKRYRDLFEINNAVMFILDPQTGMILDANDAASRFYGYNREELRALSITQINTADPDQIRNDMAHAAGSHGAEFQFRHRKKNGEIRDVQVFSAPIPLDNRVFLHSIIQDVTDRTKAEEALKQTNKKLNLLSSITRHDIRNQLMALNGYIELAQEVADNPDKVSQYLRKELQISGTIRRQIDFTKDYQDLGLNAAIWQDVDSLVRTVALGLPLERIQLIINSPGLEIFADPLLEKVFYNLIDNSLRYGGEKMTSITVSMQEREKNLQILFEDDGNGISAEDKIKLFSKGFGKNTGLGLFLSREILSITGITISERGEPGKGARFEILVPRGLYRIATSK
jgi:PAS domain S-box-containing protein